MPLLRMTSPSHQCVCSHEHGQHTITGRCTACGCDGFEPSRANLFSPLSNVHFIEELPGSLSRFYLDIVWKPGDVCQCGHPSSEHASVDGASGGGCLHGVGKICPCQKFVLQETPEEKKMPVEGSSNFPPGGSLCGCGHNRHDHPTQGACLQYSERSEGSGYCKCGNSYVDHGVLGSCAMYIPISDYCKTCGHMVTDHCGKNSDFEQVACIDCDCKRFEACKTPAEFRSGQSIRQEWKQRQSEGQYEADAAQANEDGRAEAEAVDHPAHYGGADNPFEAIKVIEAWGWGPGFCLGSALKYLSRFGKKGDADEDLNKARWYIDRLIEQRAAIQAEDALAEASGALDDEADGEPLGGDMYRAFSFLLDDLVPVGRSAEYPATAEIRRAIGNLLSKLAEAPGE